MTDTILGRPNRARAGVFSLAQASPDGPQADADYLAWHLLDHLPEQYRNPALWSTGCAGVHAGLSSSPGGADVGLARRGALRPGAPRDPLPVRRTRRSGPGGLPGPRRSSWPASTCTRPVARPSCWPTTTWPWWPPRPGVKVTPAVHPVPPDALGAYLVVEPVAPTAGS